MFKKLFSFKTAVLLVMVMFILAISIGTAQKAHALFGLAKYWAAIYDTEDNVRTDITTVTIYDAGTTDVATIYADDVGTSLTNPIVTGIDDGTFEFWTSESSVDVVLDDGIRSKMISGMTTVTPHRILLVAQSKQSQVLKFTPGDFIAIDNGGTTIIPLTASSWPQLQVNNAIVSIVWSDEQETYAQVTFKVPDDYLSGGAFRIFTDYDSGSDHPQIQYYVYLNQDDETWDANVTAQTPVDPAGTAGKPELTNLPITTDFDSLAAGDVITLGISRSDQEAGVTAELETYYVEFYYNSKE